MIAVAAIVCYTVFHVALCHTLCSLALSDACVCVVSAKTKGSLTAAHPTEEKMSLTTASAAAGL